MCDCHPASPASKSATSRRSLLKASGIAALAAPVVVACGTSDSTPAAASPTTTELVGAAPPPPRGARLTLLGTSGGPPPDYYNFFLLGGNVTNDSGDNLSGPVAVFGPGSAGALPPPKEPNSPTVSPADPTPGISRMTSDLTNAYAYSHNIFIRETAIRDVNTLIQVRDIELPSNTGASALGDTAPAMRPFTVMEDSRTRVSAILVPHGPVFPSYAFRFDTDYGSVVFSGDTRTSGNVSTLAKGADVLVHEVINLPFYQQQGLPEPLIEHFRQAHTPDTEVGGVAHDAGVESLVLSHLVPSNPRWVSDEQYTKNARSGYGGSVVVGRDLMKIDVKKNAPANVVARPTA